MQDFTQHDDDAVQVYWRSYNINSPYLKKKGTWTDWAEHVAATVRTELDDLDEAAAAAQKTADAALEVSATAQTDTRIYYKSWDGWQHYQDGTPYSGKIYIDTTTDTPYRWNGTTMKALVSKTVALTQEEYDDMAAAGTLDDDTYNNILEE